MSEQKINSRSAFTVWEILLLVVIIRFVVAVSIPNYIGPRRSDPAWKANACINNLRQIDAAANQFALENHLTNGDRINFPSDLTPYIKLNKDGKIPGCPSGGTYFLKQVGSNPTCSLGTLAETPHVLP
jgi:competence protein ComGC